MDEYSQYREGESFSIGMFAAFFLVISLLFGLLLYGVVQGIFGGMTGNVVDEKGEGSLLFLVGIFSIGILFWKRMFVGRAMDEVYAWVESFL